MAKPFIIKKQHRFIGGFTPSLENGVTPYASNKGRKSKEDYGLAPKKFSLPRRHKEATPFFSAGFTLMELLIVTAIIAILAAIIFFAIRSSRQSRLVSQAGFIQGQMTLAAARYASRMGFYPPDVNRGWDPGFVRSLPWNADAAAGESLGGYTSPGTDCSHCPSNWQDIVQAKWDGPYLPEWSRRTSWNGKYDYNYWGSGATRYGCSVPAGVYLGVQGDYNDNNKIPSSAEAEMAVRGFDADNCVNGESQLTLRRF